MLVDPNQIDSKGTTAIDWYEPSLDGKKVAVSLSKGGSEDGTLHFYDAGMARNSETRSHMCNTRPRAGARVGTADATGVYYTRFPRKGERPDSDLNFYQRVYFHKLGTPDSADTYQVGKSFRGSRRSSSESSADGKYVLASVANGDGGDFAHYLRGPGGEWRQITRFEDGVKLARLGRDNALYLLSRADAPARQNPAAKSGSAWS